MTTRKPRPVTETEALHRITGQLGKLREEEPARFTPLEGWARLKLQVDTIGERMRGLDGESTRALGVELAALATRFVVECT